MLTIFYGNTGTGKSYAMMDKIKADAENGFQVCVVVPDQFTFEYERMLYDHMGCALFNKGNTDVLSFSRLTADIFRNTSAPSGNPADSTVKTAVMYRVIDTISQREGFLHFGRQAKRPSFVNTALTMISEAAHSRITPEVMGNLLQNAPEFMHDKLSDLYLIYSEYTNELEKLSMRDTLHDVSMAAEAAVNGNYFSGMHIYIDEFKSFTGDQYNMIKAMLSQCAELTVCMTADSCSETGFGPCSAVNETCAALCTAAYDLGVPCERVKFTENRRYRSEAVRHMTENLFRIPPEVYTGEYGDISVIEASDLYGECSYICSEIRRITAEDKSIRYSDIAVLSRNMNEDISVLSAHFKRYDIPFYSDRKPSASHKPLMLAISSGLELASGKNISTETLLRYAKTGLTRVSRDDVLKLENYCYKWDIDGAMWKEEFPDEDCEKIKNALLDPVFELKDKCVNKTGAQICEAVREFIADTEMESILLEREPVYITQAESAAEKRENERLCEMLDEILADMEISLDCSLTLAQFREIFILSAGKITLAKPPDALDGVAAMQSDLARLTNPKIVFVMHANDGVFPMVTGESTTFSERERDFFKNADYRLSGDMKKRMAEERFNAFKAVCAPSDKLYISYSRADFSGKALYPSMFIDRIYRCIPNVSRTDADKLGMLFYCRTESAAYSAAAENFDPSDESFFTVRSVLSENPVYKNRFDYIERIDTGAGHKINDKNLMRRLYGNTLELSASRFEDYQKCPFMYFCRTGLKLYPLQKAGLNPAERGNIMHLCLKEIMENNRGDSFISMTKEQFSEEINKVSDNYISENLGGKFAKKKNFEFYLDIMKSTLITVLTHIQNEMRSSSFVPVSFEMPIGKKLSDRIHTDVIPVIISCGEGTSINFTGTADRIDSFMAEDGRVYIRIIDYKSGVKAFMPEQLALGINLQMFLYLFTVTDEESGIYSGCVPAGALYLPVKYPEHSKDRRADEESVKTCIESTMKMQGAVLADPMIINAMEKDCSGRFIPVSFNKNGTVSARSSVFDKASLDKIKELYMKLLRDMCSGLYSGKIEASPLEAKKYKCLRPCSFCDYKEVCGNYPNTVLRDISDVDFDFLGKEGDE